MIILLITYYFNEVFSSLSIKPSGEKNFFDIYPGYGHRRKFFIFLSKEVLYLA